MEYIIYLNNCRNKDYGKLLIQEHHIIPKSQGGTDDKDNLINLSLHDHFWAHVYYAKETGKCKTAPSWMLHTYCTKENFTEEEWNEAAKVAYELHSEAMKLIAKRTRKPHSEETKRKMSLAAMGNKRGLGRKDSDEVKEKRASKRRGTKNTEETKKRMSESAKKRPPMSEETKQKISIANKSKKRAKPIISDEIRQKMSENKKGKTWILIEGKRVWN